MTDVNVKVPSAPERTVTGRMPAAPDSVIDAPTTTAPCESATRPDSDAVCAHAAADPRTRLTIRMKRCAKCRTGVPPKRADLLRIFPGYYRVSRSASRQAPRCTMRALHLARQPARVYNGGRGGRDERPAFHEDTSVSRD